MPFELVVEFVAFGSTGVVDAPEPEPEPVVAPFAVPGVEPDPLLEPEAFDWAIADVASASASAVAERSLMVMVGLLGLCVLPPPNRPPPDLFRLKSH
ncbi:hypothetical protein X742_27225 [Mesorhizobium sp. LNHC232B00]|nr:hypothetical protein X742_27225 [Mesorhizobium sp. LNHC232B00]